MLSGAQIGDFLAVVESARCFEKPLIPSDSILTPRIRLFGRVRLFHSSRMLLSEILIRFSVAS